MPPGAPPPPAQPPDGTVAASVRGSGSAVGAELLHRRADRLAAERAGGGRVSGDDLPVRPGRSVREDDFGRADEPNAAGGDAGRGAAGAIFSVAERVAALPMGGRPADTLAVGFPSEAVRRRCPGLVPRARGGRAP